MTPANQPQQMQTSRSDVERERDKAELRQKLLDMIRNRELLRREQPHRPDVILQP